MLPRLSSPWKIPQTRPHEQPIRRPYPLLKGCVLALLPVRDNKWYDFSGNGNHGTLNGAVWTAKGRFGPGMYFDGTDDYVEVSNSSSLSINGNITVCAWVFLNAVGGFIAKKASGMNGFVLGMNHNTNKWFYWIGDSSDEHPREAGTPATGEWTFVTLSFKEYEWQRLYINEELLDEVPSVSWTLSNAAIALFIGYKDWFAAPQAWVNGIIDSLYIYNRILSKDERNRLYELGRPY